MAASVPQIWPAQSWTEPAVFRTSVLMILRMAFAIIRRTVSQMPIDLTPGFLSKATSRHANKAVIPWGSTCSEHNLLVTMARKLQRLTEADLKQVHSRFHPLASIPDGPAAPSVCSATDWIRVASMPSKIAGCECGGSEGRVGRLTQAGLLGQLDVSPEGSLEQSQKRPLS